MIYSCEEGEEGERWGGEIEKKGRGATGVEQRERNFFSLLHQVFPLLSSLHAYLQSFCLPLKRLLHKLSSCKFFKALVWKRESSAHNQHLSYFMFTKTCFFSSQGFVPIWVCHHMFKRLPLILRVKLWNWILYLGRWIQCRFFFITVLPDSKDDFF